LVETGLRRDRFFLPSFSEMSNFFSLKEGIDVAFNGFLFGGGADWVGVDSYLGSGGKLEE